MIDLPKSAHSAVGSESDFRFRVMSFILFQSYTFMEINHEIFSMVILLLSLIQEGLLSVTREIMCTKYWLTA